MVIKRIKEALEQRRQRKAEEALENNRLESYRESEQMRKAEQIKKEADRLAHLRQYKTAIDEYNKALEAFPFDEQEAKFRKPAEFFFKCYFNMGASYTFLNDFDSSIENFDKALAIGNIDNENKVKALMNKGNCYYKARKLMHGDFEHRADALSEDQSNSIKKLDDKHGLFSLALECFSKATEIEKNNADAWYKKGQMEFLMDKAKDAMLSFDKVLEIDKGYENKERIVLFEDIKSEKGISSKHSKEVFEDSTRFKTKTGHYVKSRAEKIIADFLFEHNLVFQYDIAVSWADKDDFRALFYVPKLDLYLDHFNFDNSKLMSKRIKQYDKSRKKLAYTLLQDEANMEDALKIKLKPYIIL